MGSVSLLTREGEVEIAKGLQAGETLIVRGLQRVRPGAQVAIQRPTI